MKLQGGAAPLLARDWLEQSYCDDAAPELLFLGTASSNHHYQVNYLQSSQWPLHEA